MNPNTLVTKFLGMYRVKLYHLRRNVKFVVMKSVYDTDKHLHHVYDVKGSSTGRDAKAGEVVKKDNDVRRSLPEGAFILEPDLRDRLRIQVERDCQWLKAMKIMDYSMLIGVHNIVQSAHKRNTSTPSKPKKLLAENATTQLEYYGDEFSHTSLDASCMNLDQYLDDDDDDSYLDGSTRQRKSDDVVHALRSADGESEEYVEKAIEDMYWPFHRYYDLQGRRRLMPIKADLIAQENRCLNGNELTEPDASSKKKYFKLFSSSSAPSSFGESPQYQIPVFERPLSERKDGGFTMDLTNVETPLKINIPGAPHLAEYCEGKIFYMGIIDILQQFNIRKRLEARWRRMGGKGWEAASCVHPTIYADRFLRFFDEYTACQREQNNTGNGK
jgi:1-phosphatidylinositol-4-phosphate 5-kinase